VQQRIYFLRDIDTLLQKFTLIIARHWRFDSGGDELLLTITLIADIVLFITSDAVFSHIQTMLQPFQRPSLSAQRQ
jgi:hypothetical protein